jgi:hypothetical protein
VDVWLIGDPNADGGGAGNWSICPAPIEADRLTLLETDLNESLRMT